MKSSAVSHSALAKLQSLRQSDSLWSDKPDVSIARVLSEAVDLFAVDVATIWILQQDGSTMLNTVRWERQAGRAAAGAVLQERDCPEYFSAVRGDRVVDVEDALNDPRTCELAETYLAPAGVRSLLDTAIRSDGHVVGILCLEHHRECRGWSESEQATCIAFAELCGQILLVHELRRNLELLQLLADAAPELQTYRSANDLANLATRVVHQLFPNVWVGFGLFASGGGSFEMQSVAGDGIPREVLEATRRLKVEDSAVLQLCYESQRINVINLDDHAPEHGVLALAARHGVRSIIGVPLQFEGNVLGAVVIWARTYGYTEHEYIRNYEAFAGSIAVALANSIHVEKLRHMAFHDALTGLPNREHLLRQIKSLRQTYPSEDVVLLLVNIRQFGAVNNTLGRKQGDTLLIALANRLGNTAALAGGEAFRLGGTEFALLLHGINRRQQALGFAHEVLERVGEPVEAGGISLLPTAVVGVACSQDVGEDTAELLRAADIALGWARASNSPAEVYDSHRDNSGPKSLVVLAELREALRSNQLSLHFQPKVDVISGTLIGCEALVRWVHPARGIVPPDAFIPIAEAGNLMRPITQWVVEAAVGAAAQLISQGLRVQIAINVSAQNLLDVTFPAYIESQIQAAKLEVDCLALELTETVLMSSPEQSAQVIAQLTSLGLGMDIDDYGTGYSSLAYLRRLPLRSIKIDRTFVNALVSNETDQVIVRSTVAMGHELGLKIVAEGVEDQATLDMLREFGCDVAQGYHVSRPLPLPQFIDWAQARENARAVCLPTSESNKFRQL